MHAKRISPTPYLAIILILGVSSLSIDQPISSEYTIFSSNFEKIFSTISLTGLLLLIYSSKTARYPQAIHPIRAWRNTLLIVLILASSCFLLANPYGTVPWKQRSAYIGLKFRTTKLDLYNTQEALPEILVFGSSRAFSIAPTTLESILNKKAFNFSVEGGSPVDFLAFYNYLRNQKASADPVLILVELVSPMTGVNVWEQRLPIQLALYLPTKLSIPFAGKFIATSLNSKTLTDSAYISIYQVNEQTTWQIFNDGRLEPEIPDREAYFQAISNNSRSVISKNSQCSSLDSYGVIAIKELVRITKRSNTAIVFYRSPLSIDFYNAVDTNTDLFVKCQALFNEFMDSLKKDNPNVFFTDLSRYNPISDQGLNVFIDYQHLAPNGADMVIQALAPQLKEALGWAIKHRK